MFRISHRAVVRRDTQYSQRIGLKRIRMRRILPIIAIGFASSILSGLLGIGGGVVMIPAMVYLLGIDQHEAHGTSLSIMSPIVLFSAIFYASHGQMDWLAAAELSVGGIIGAALGAKLACRLSGIKLRMYFGVFLAIIGARISYDAVSWLTGSHVAAPVAPMFSSGNLSGCMIVLAMGLLTGILSGILGIGGGIVMIPLMSLFLGFSQKLAQGISLAVIIPVSLSGAFVHGKHGNLRWDVGIWLATGGIAGGLLGAHMAISLNPFILKGLFGILMLVMGMLTVRRSSAACS